MQIKIKQFEVDMEVKTSGIEFEIRKPDGSSQIGDCYVTKKALIWCKGKTTKKNGVALKWDDLAIVLKSKESLKAALKAAKEA